MQIIALAESIICMFSSPSFYYNRESEYPFLKIEV